MKTLDPSLNKDPSRGKRASGNVRAGQRHLGLPSCLTWKLPGVGNVNWEGGSTEKRGREGVGFMNSLSTLVSRLSRPDSGVSSSHKKTRVQHQDSGGGMGRDIGLISLDMRTSTVNGREGKGESMTEAQRLQGDTQASRPKKKKKIRGIKEGVEKQQ